ncbi:Oidioi.mRNA.OKI2018_I69.PAR.g13028.t1.cds [Oikopleura dioica]|uniref:Oidioi.mRNA.OKI2018_I69.PAR.g13028.t1.cds n=1 Tax=Oikopleura dioica TaxID=34765 RepID=A0ABN7S2S3_OIKDI|nr:Oidioi.mRNA.OKI2018_I69.PAR.g13028.t1.cds [Oikopleura dioica]
MTKNSNSGRLVRNKDDESDEEFVVVAADSFNSQYKSPKRAKVDNAVKATTKVIAREIDGGNAAVARSSVDSQQRTNTEAYPRTHQYEKRKVETLSHPSTSAQVSTNDKAVCSQLRKEINAESDSHTASFDSSTSSSDSPNARSTSLSASTATESFDAGPDSTDHFRAFTSRRNPAVIGSGNNRANVDGQRQCNYNYEYEYETAAIFSSESSMSSQNSDSSDVSYYPGNNYSTNAFTDSSRFTFCEKLQRELLVTENSTASDRSRRNSSDEARSNSHSQSARRGNSDSSRIHGSTDQFSQQPSRRVRVGESALTSKFERSSNSEQAVEFAVYEECFQRRGIFGDMNFMDFDLPDQLTHFSSSPYMDGQWRDLILLEVKAKDWQKVKNRILNNPPPLILPFEKSSPTTTLRKQTMESFQTLESRILPTLANDKNAQIYTTYPENAPLLTAGDVAPNPRSYKANPEYFDADYISVDSLLGDVNFTNPSGALAALEFTFSILDIDYRVVQDPQTGVQSTKLVSRAFRLINPNISEVMYRNRFANDSAVFDQEEFVLNNFDDEVDLTVELTTLLGAFSCESYNFSKKFLADAASLSKESQKIVPPPVETTQTNPEVNNANEDEFAKPRKSERIRNQKLNTIPKCDDDEEFEYMTVPLEKRVYNFDANNFPVENPDDLQTTHQEEDVALTDAFILPSNEIRQQNRERLQNEHSAGAGSAREDVQQLSRIDDDVSGRVAVNKFRGTSHAKPDTLPTNRIVGLEETYRDANGPGCPRFGVSQPSKTQESGHAHSYDRPVYRQLPHDTSRRPESIVLGSPQSTGTMGASSMYNSLETAAEPLSRRITVDDVVSYIREIVDPLERIRAALADRTSVQLLPAALDVFNELRVPSSTAPTSAFSTAVSVSAGESNSATSSNRPSHPSTRQF